MVNIDGVAEAILDSLEQTAEIDGPINFLDLALIGMKIGVPSSDLYVSCGSGEKLRINVPVNKPIRNTPMGERAT